MNPSKMGTGALRIAFVSNDAYRVESLSEMANQTGWQFVATVDSKQPEEWIGEQDADLALIDLEIGGAVLLLAHLAANQPELPLIALATPQHLVELQDALLAGAKAFIPFPANPQQFVATVTRVVHGEVKETPKDAGTSRVIAITGLKGGVGRSTVAVNLAAALKQKLRSDVVLVEAHHGLSDVSVMMNLHPSRTVANLAIEENVDADIVEGNLHLHSSGVKLLAAPTEIDQLVEMPVESWRLVLEQLSTLAPTIIIDTSSVADHLLSEILTRADDILVITEPHMSSLNGARALLESLRRESDIHGVIHLVVNRAGLQGSISSSAIAKRLGEPVVAELADDSPLVTYAINRGVPVVLSHPRTALSRQFTTLAQRFRGHVGAAEGEESFEEESGPLATLRNKASVIASLF